jgi:hypothetical protein
LRLRAPSSRNSDLSTHIGTISINRPLQKQAFSWVCAMAARRHFGRFSPGVLPSDASPYQAMCLIIGESLKERYGLPDAVPTSMEDLLRQLQEEDASSER